MQVLFTSALSSEQIMMFLAVFTDSSWPRDGALCSFTKQPRDHIFERSSQSVSTCSLALPGPSAIPSWEELQTAALEASLCLGQF